MVVLVSNVLATLLPGFRHTRTPLVAGSLWLLIAWVLFGADSPLLGDGALERKVEDLNSVLGDHVVLIGATLLAVLVGGMAPRVPVGDIAKRLKVNHAGRVNEFWLWMFGMQYDSVFSVRAGDFDNWLHRVAATVPETITWSDFTGRMCPPHMQVWARDLSEPGTQTANINGRTVSWADVSWEPDDPVAPQAWLMWELAASSIETEVSSELPLRLQVESESLFNEFDRVREEGELRATIILPLTILVASLVTVSGYWAFALVLPIWLLRQAVQAHVEADQRLRTAVRHGAVGSSTIEFIDFLRGREVDPVSGGSDSV